MEIEQTPVPMKVWKLYYKSSEQKIKVYAGTPQNEIIFGIREIFGLGKEVKFDIVDGDGVPIIVSSSISNGTSMYLSLRRTDLVPPPPPPPGGSNSLSIDLKFCPSLPYQILEDEKTVKTDPGVISQAGEGYYGYHGHNNKGTAVTNRTFIGKGKFYFVLEWKGTIYYTIGGVVELRPKPFFREYHQQLINVVGYEYGHDSEYKGIGFGDNKTIQIGHFVDMGEKKITITDHRTKKIKFTKSFTFDKVTPAVYIKSPEMSCTIISCTLDVPQYCLSMKKKGQEKEAKEEEEENTKVTGRKRKRDEEVEIDTSGHISKKQKL